MLIKKYDKQSDILHYGLVGCDWMPYELSLNVLGMYKLQTGIHKNSRTITCNLILGTYLTSSMKFSLGNRAGKFITRSNQFIHDSKDSVIKEIKYQGLFPEQYEKFDIWYRNILTKGSKPFYVKNARFDHNWFYLRMTDAMINNIFRSLSLADGQLWINHVNWTLTKKFTTYEQLLILDYKKGVQKNAELPGEVWTS